MKLKGLALALVALLALTGCAEIGSLSEKAQIDVALDTLASGLDELAGITTEYTAELQADYSYRVEVHATAGPLDTDELVAAAVLASAELGSGVFGRAQTSFDLAVPEGVVLTLLDFDRTEPFLRSNLHLAGAVGAAYGSTPTLSVGEGTSIGMLSPSTSPDWDSIRKVVSSSIGVSWSFPGLSFESTMPPTELTDLVDGIGAIVPLGFGSGLYVSADWFGDGVIVTVAADGVDVADPTASGMWPQVEQVAAQIAASPLPARSLMFYGLDKQGAASVYFGECSNPVTIGESDTVLATALAGAHAGQCLTA